MIYADNAATTRMSDAARKTMTALQEETWGNPSSLYAHGQRAKEALEEARQKVAAAIGADPREILFTSGGSEADNQAIRSAAEWGKQKGKTHILSTAIEHHAVLHTLERLKKRASRWSFCRFRKTGSCFRRRWPRRSGRTRVW